MTTAQQEIADICYVFCPFPPKCCSARFSRSQSFLFSTCWFLPRLPASGTPLISAMAPSWVGLNGTSRVATWRNPIVLASLFSLKSFRFWFEDRPSMTMSASGTRTYHGGRLCRFATRHMSELHFPESIRPKAARYSHSSKSSSSSFVTF